MNAKTVTLIMTGASGVDYGLRLLEELIKAKVTVYLLLSRPARIVIKMETGLNLPSQSKEVAAYFTKRYNAVEGQLQVFGKEQWLAPIASGSGVADATVICPCTTGTLSAVAVGSSNNLLERAADVAIKERKKLILVIRETPFSTLHLQNMLTLSQMGVVIMPANPGFYQLPKTIDDLIDFMVARILDHLAIPHLLVNPWGESNHS